jgi:hypothetical protein
MATFSLVRALARADRSRTSPTRGPNRDARDALALCFHQRKQHIACFGLQPAELESQAKEWRDDAKRGLGLQRQRPGATLAFRASMPPRMKSLRQRQTVSSRTPNASAIRAPVQPLSVSSTARARSASPRSRHATPPQINAKTKSQS